jgi:hypothetical protein
VRGLGGTTNGVEGNSNFAMTVVHYRVKPLATREERAGRISGGARLSATAAASALAMPLAGTPA